jgi:hypothetical protein
MILRQLVFFILIAVSDMALANPSCDQVLHSWNEKWDAIERRINKDTRLRCSLAPMPTPLLASLAPCLFMYATLNSLLKPGLGLA